MGQIVKELLQESISKWEKRANNTRPSFPSVKDCPLCQHFHRSGKFFMGEHCCKGCPVFEKTKQMGCEGTPVDLYIDAFDEYVYNNDGDFEDIGLAAEREVRFLKSLLEEINGS